MLEVTVTKEHFSTEYMHDCQKCAVSQAVNEHLPKGYFCSTGYDRMSIHNIDDVNDTIYNLPMDFNLSYCVYSYDRGMGKNLQDITFSLPISITEDNKVVKDSECLAIVKV